MVHYEMITPYKPCLDTSVAAHRDDMSGRNTRVALPVYGARFYRLQDIKECRTKCWARRVCRSLPTLFFTRRNDARSANACDGRLQDGHRQVLCDKYAQLFSALIYWESRWFVYACMHIYAYMYVCAYVYMCVCVCVCMCMRICVCMHTHTHIRTWWHFGALQEHMYVYVCSRKYSVSSDPSACLAGALMAQSAYMTRARRDIQDVEDLLAI